MEIKQGTIKYSAGTKTFDSKYSDKPQQSILISMEDGTEERIYFDKGRLPHAQLQRGESVQIVYTVNKQGKKIRQLVAHPSRDHQGVAVAPDYRPNEVKNSIKPLDFVAEKLEIFETVYEAVKLRLEETIPDLKPEDIRAITTSILIEGDRKHIQFKELIEDVPEENF